MKLTATQARRADEIYARRCREIEANMDRRDISCQHYQNMREWSERDAVEESSNDAAGDADV